MKYFSVKGRKKAIFYYYVTYICMLALCIRLYFISVVKHDYYLGKAREVQERCRTIKAKRGIIYDRNGYVLADNRIVYTVSVIHNQIDNTEKVIKSLTEVLSLDEETVRKKVEKRSIREIIKVNVSKEKAKELEKLKLEGVKIDADYKRYYPYNELASKVIGFTGADNQGILGLEVKYDKVLTGENGYIYAVTTARGIEIEGEAGRRKEGIPGNSLVTSIDIRLQKYAEDMANMALERHKAKRVCIIMMNPQNGEIYALVDTPEYNLNEPFNITFEENNQKKTDADKMDLLNKMWRCFPINDTYEPGSIFKIVTACAGLNEGVVSLKEGFYCPGYRVVADRRIRCHKVSGHGSETFEEGFMQSCNPVFIDVGIRVGTEKFYEYVEKLGFFEKTNIDLPGEASSIFHKPENVGPLELATMSFGQSFQITPMQLIRAVSAVVNGGTLITPHFGMYVVDNKGNIIEKLKYNEKEGAIDKVTSDKLRELLRLVIDEGGGGKAKIEGFSIGGKTATSEKLPRGNGKYISSFIGFAPVNEPKIITFVMIDEPVGVYYGGTIAAPIVGQMFRNILPYMGIENGEEKNE